jgi:predicted NAD/FAD-dependent oxidoreductase
LLKVQSGLCGIRFRVSEQALQENTTSIGIIGAGMAGLSCARRLAHAGIQPTILDKGRGLGGRLATRRTDNGLQFDHGAQYVTGRDASFRSLLAEMEEAGCCGRWTVEGKERAVGAPGMNTMAKHLARGLEIRQRAEVSGLRQTANGWEVSIAGQRMHFARLVVTIPAPQVAALLGQTHELSQRVSCVRMLPCLTLMAAFASGAPEPFVTRRDPDDPIAWIALDSSKLGRMTEACWVAQAGPNWSAARLDLDPADIADQMLDLLCDRIGVSRSSAIHAVAHRWRYASVAEALGAPFVRNEEASLYLGGDWCLQGRVEAAWKSGTAIAGDLIANF